MSYQLRAIRKLCQDACQRLMLYIPTSLPQEQAAKTNMASVVRIQVLCRFEEGVSNTYLHMTDHAPMKVEKHYTCWIERRWAGFRPLSVQYLNSI